MALPAVQKQSLTREEAIAEAHRRAMKATSQEMAEWMWDVFGRGITALVSGVDKPATVTHWVQGTKPDSATLARLRTAFQIATLIAMVDSPQTARAWFIGMNPELDQSSAAMILADEPDRASEVMDAALYFLAHG